MRYVMLAVVGLCCVLLSVDWRPSSPPRAPLSKAPEIEQRLHPRIEPAVSIPVAEMVEEDAEADSALVSSLVTKAVFAPLHTWVASTSEARQDALDMVTEQGLFERTTGWWDQSDFLALTGDELFKLVPECVTLGYPFAGDSKLADLVGGLPNYDDCARAFRDDDVRRVLVDVAALEIPINGLGMTPLEARTPQWQTDFDALVTSLHRRELDLAREMERASGYAHWSILQRAFVAWNSDHP